MPWPAGPKINRRRASANKPPWWEEPFELIQQNRSGRSQTPEGLATGAIQARVGAATGALAALQRLMIPSPPNRPATAMNQSGERRVRSMSTHTTIDTR